MKKTLQRFGIVTVGLSLCLWSCKEDNKLVQPSETAVSKEIPKIKEKIDFSVVDGRLKFETNDDFSSAIAQASSQKGAKTWEDVSGFTSLDEAYSKYVIENAEKVIGEVSEEYDDAVFILTDNKGKKSYERTVTMPSLAALLNQKGTVQIGNKVMKISDEEVRITEMSFKNELELESPSSHVKINKVVHGDFDKKASKGAKVNSEYNRHDSKPYGGGSTGFSDRRLLNHKYAKIYNVGYTFLLEIGCHILNQRSNWNGWGQENIDSWSIDAGYIQIIPNFSTTNTTIILTGGSWTWSAQSNIAGHANIYIGAYANLNPPQGYQLPEQALTITFNPGVIRAYTNGLAPVELNNLSFDSITLPVWSNASI